MERNRIVQLEAGNEPVTVKMKGRGWLILGMVCLYSAEFWTLYLYQFPETVIIVALLSTIKLILLPFMIKDRVLISSKYYAERDHLDNHHQLHHSCRNDGN